MSASAPIPPLPRGCEPACPGCSHRRLSLADSLRQKQDWLERRLAPWRHRLEAVCSAGEAARLGYRDKVCLSCEWRQGRWHIGLQRRDAVLAIPDCPVHSRRVREALGILLGVLPPPEHGFPLAYYVQSGAQLTLILKTPRLPGTGWLTATAWQALREAGIEGLWLHLHPCAGRRLFHRSGWHLLAGEAESVDDAGCRYGPAAFRQLIPSLHRHSLEEAGGHLAITPGDRVADLYCGNGAGLRRWTRAGAECIGVELSGDACRHAAHNAPAATVLRGTCEQRLPQLHEWAARRTARHLLYLNPPRTGLESAVTRWVSDEYRPARLAYLSCSAGTLARDLALLETGGYRVTRILPYDFFPNTHHVETLALLEEN